MKDHDLLDDLDLSLTVKIGLTAQAHEDAQKFAAQQLSTQKSKQVYLNTLAIYAVHIYLGWFDLESDLYLGDSWDQKSRILFDVADVVLPNIGRLECRPILANESEITLPISIHQDLLGYMGVKFMENLSEAELLGFLPYQEDCPLPYLKIQELQPLETLLDVLESKRIVNLRQWLENKFNQGWFALEDILSKKQLDLSYGFRSSTNKFHSLPPNLQENRIERGKIINLQGTAVALIIFIYPSPNHGNRILLQVHPTIPQSYLPSDLKLLVWDRAAPSIRMEAVSRQRDNYLQLEFTASEEEAFGVTISLGEVEMTEAFLI